MTTLPEDMTFVLDQKKRYFWNQRAIKKTESSYASHRAIKRLSWKRRRKEVLRHFDTYCNQLGDLIDDAVPTFVELVSRLEGLSVADRTGIVRRNVEDCIITPSITRTSLVRWLADACESHPPLEVLRALHEDPNTWIAPRWLTPPRTRVERKKGVWFFVSGSKRVKVSRQFALQYRKRLGSLSVNLPTIDLVIDLEIRIGAQLEGILDRALARSIEKLLPARSSESEKRANRSIQSEPKETLAAIAHESSTERSLTNNDRFGPYPQPPVQSEEDRHDSSALPETDGAEQSQVITHQTYFIIEAKALVHSQDRPGELIAAYSAKGPHLTDVELLSFSKSSKELLEKLKSMRADHQMLLIHWAKSEQELEQLPAVLRAYVSLKETARLPNLKHVNEAVRDLRLVFESDKKKRGRPRQDALSERVQELRQKGHSWSQIQMRLNKETGVERTSGAYRNLLRSRQKAGSA